MPLTIPDSVYEQRAQLAIEEADRLAKEKKRCPSCRHPEGDCGGDYIHKDDAAEFVADSYEPPDEC